MAKIHLLHHFVDNIINFGCADNVFGKMNLWSDWQCFLTVSSQSFVVFFFNMILVNGKTIFRNQESDSFTYDFQ